MDALDLIGDILQTRAGDPILDLAARLLYVERLRPPLFRGVERMLTSYLGSRGTEYTGNQRVNREHLLTASAVLDTVGSAASTHLAQTK